MDEWFCIFFQTQIVFLLSGQVSWTPVHDAGMEEAIFGDLDLGERPQQGGEYFRLVPLAVELDGAGGLRNMLCSR
jgi:hypothetical protein